LKAANGLSQLFGEGCHRLAGTSTDQREEALFELGALIGRAASTRCSAARGARAPAIQQSVGGVYNAKAFERDTGLPDPPRRQVHAVDAAADAQPIPVFVR
jgi:hypothetical protein